MPSLTPTELTNLEAALRERQAFLADQIETASDLKHQEVDRYRDVGLHDQGEESAEEQVIDNANAVIDHLRAELAEVGGALRRFEHGDYGVCRDCGNDIPVSRLHAQLHATRCLNCQDKVDHRP